MKIKNCLLLLVFSVITSSAQEINKLEKSESDLLSKEELLEDYLNRQCVKDICGVEFGSSYDKALQFLRNKFGEPYEMNKEVISFNKKDYAGFIFDSINFMFKYDGISSFLYLCYFTIGSNTEKEAIDIMEQLQKKLAQKYVTVDGVSNIGTKMYAGGLPPKGIKGDTAYKLSYANIRSGNLTDDKSYCVVLMYGPFEYVKEEF